MINWFDRLIDQSSNRGSVVYSKGLSFLVLEQYYPSTSKDSPRALGLLSFLVLELYYPSTSKDSPRALGLLVLAPSLVSVVQGADP